MTFDHAFKRILKDSHRYSSFLKDHDDGFASSRDKKNIKSDDLTIFSSIYRFILNRIGNHAVDDLKAGDIIECENYPNVLFNYKNRYNVCFIVTNNPCYTSNNDLLISVHSIKKVNGSEFKLEDNWYVKQ